MTVSKCIVAYGGKCELFHYMYTRPVTGVSSIVTDYYIRIVVELVREALQVVIVSD